MVLHLIVDVIVCLLVGLSRLRAYYIIMAYKLPNPAVSY